MLIDVYNVVIALTLAVTGILLVRDYARFLTGVHSIKASVTSIQQVFLPPPTETSSYVNRFVVDGYYPVVQYNTESGPVSFTVTDQEASGRFHIGDRIRLRVTKTRRKENRVCKSFTLLGSLLCLLIAGLLASAFVEGIQLNAAQIVVASFVLAFCLLVIARFKRDQEDFHSLDMMQSQTGLTQLCLSEPTAFKYWRTTMMDRSQLNKVRSSQFFGFACFGAAAVVVIAAVYPSVTLFIDTAALFDTLASYT